MLRTAPTAERRAFGRRESFIHAIARLPGRGAEPCVVRNFSDTGALIEFKADFVAPDRFRLDIEAKGFSAVCEAKRRDGRMLGVRFVGANATETLMDRVAGTSAPEPGHDELPVDNVLVKGQFVTVARGDAVRAALAT
jgi:hypothetical protein